MRKAGFAEILVAVAAAVLCGLLLGGCQTFETDFDFAGMIVSSSSGNVETVVANGSGELVGPVLEYKITSEADKTCRVIGVKVSQRSKKVVDIPAKIRYMGTVYAVTSVGDYAFDGLKHAKITIPEGVSSIGSYAFRNCRSLTDMVIPGAVRSIGDEAFYACWELKKVMVETTTPPSLEPSAFSECASDLKIYVPKGSVEAYKEAAGWSTYAERIVGHGDGSEERPYSVADVCGGATGTGVWVKGYIVGFIDGTSIEMGATFGANGNVRTNILIADVATETNVANCVPVQLAVGTVVREGLNLGDNPGNLGKVVMVQGNLETYFQVPGVKSVSAYILSGPQKSE